jgi:membrane protease YdiL (CAAX protease family)
MVTQATTTARGRSLATHLRGHILRFDPRRLEITPRAGVRLLAVAVVLEFARLAVVHVLHDRVPLWVLMAAWLALALWTVPGIAKIRLPEIGLRPWREWTATEKSYCVQVVVIANVVFSALLVQRVASREVPAGVEPILTGVFVPYLFFGFYQELVYRGMLQLELVRRTNAFVGIAAANVLYTFGPLHWNYFAARASFAVPMFAAIFAIGLFFGVLYRRSGNLWLPAIFHAIGNAYIVSGAGPSA